MNKKIIKLNNKGFTLVELLVVIAIIAILAVVGITIFSGTQAVARDSRRKADIDSIAAALEANYNSVSGKYRWWGNTMFASGATPVDPTNSGSYVYTTNIADLSTTWYYCAKMEANGGTGGNSADSTFSGTGTAFYCKKPQQS